MVESDVTLIQVRDPDHGSLLSRLRARWRLRSALRGVGTEWTLLVFMGGGDGTIEAASGSLDRLIGQLALGDRDEANLHRVFFFRSSLQKLIRRSSSRIGAEATASDRYVILLPRRRSAPTKRKLGRSVDAFTCDVATLRAGAGRGRNEEPAELPFHVVMSAIDRNVGETRLLARQLPARRRIRSPGPTRAESVRVVIPHRGSIDHLKACLSRTEVACAELDAQIHVVIDEEVSSLHHDVVREFPDVNFWRTSECHGPYVPRHLLGTAAHETYVAFQDSDDVPCDDRFGRSLSELVRHRADLTGCHVLDVDEEERVVRPCRYPLDAVRPLRSKPQNTVFHPSLVMKTTALIAAGGLSTVRRFASDREFNLRSFFLSLRMRNVDEFLYIRRLRPDSLIHSTETGMRTQTRQALHQAWHADFHRIQRGDLALERSSLAATHLDPMPVLIPLDRVVVPIA